MLIKCFVCVRVAYSVVADDMCPIDKSALSSHKVIDKFQKDPHK